MATAATTTNTSVSIITGHCVAGEAKFGGDGAIGGADEVSVGHDTSDFVSARRTWDGNPVDGVDSSLVFVTLTADAGGGASGVSWSVAGASVAPLVYGGRTYGTIGQVLVRAGVQITGTAAWTELQVKFFRAGRLTESYNLTAGPAVDTTAGPGFAAEQILAVTPGFANNTKVTVSGYVRFTAPEGVAPQADDLLAQVFVYANSCAAAV